MSKTQEITRPVSSVQALEALKIVKGKVHSFLNAFYGLAGADMELSRIKDMLKDSEAQEKLFLSDTLNCVGHDILAWDQKYQEWLYLECDKEKVVQLKALLVQ